MTNLVAVYFSLADVASWIAISIIIRGVSGYEEGTQRQNLDYLFLCFVGILNLSTRSGDSSFLSLVFQYRAINAHILFISSVDLLQYEKFFSTVTLTVRGLKTDRVADDNGCVLLLTETPRLRGPEGPPSTENVGIPVMCIEMALSWSSRFFWWSENAVFATTATLLQDHHHELRPVAPVSISEVLINGQGRPPRARFFERFKKGGLIQGNLHRGEIPWLAAASFAKEGTAI